MSLDAFTRPGRFWRGNLHGHSDRSDGELAPEEVCRRYRAEGYDFTALTDHFLGRFGYPLTDTTAFREPGFTTLLGAELHSGVTENGAIWHILAVGLPPGFAPPDAPDPVPRPGQETGPEIAARAAAAGAFVAIAHPQWSGLTLADGRALDAAHAVEIYNHGSATKADRGDGWHLLDPLLAEGRELTAIATDDSHFRGADHFGGWVMVKAAENAPEALLAALKDGAFYASQGPELRDIRLTGDGVEVECSACETVILQGPGQRCPSVHGRALTRACLPLGEFAAAPWVRVTIRDAAGGRAWSNPFRPAG